MFGVSGWQILRGVAFDKFVKRPLLALARLGRFLAVWL